MKKLLLVAALFSLAGVSEAVTSPGSVTFATNTGQVTVSTVPATPTQILTSQSFISRTIIVNPTAFNLYLSTANVTISTSLASGAAFFVPPASSFSPDGPQDAYNGPMWAVLGATATSGGTSASQSTIGVYRAK